MYWPKPNAYQITSAVSTALISGILFLIAIKGHASILLVVPLSLVIFSYITRILIKSTPTVRCLLTETKPISERKAVVSCLVGCFVAFAFTYPHSINQLRFTNSVRSILVKEPVLGVNLPPEGVIEAATVRKFITEHNAKNIFSYPIRPEYYAFAPAHGTTVVEFESQTTKDEIATAISDLGRSRPTVVIRDLNQVADLSSVVQELSDFIMSHYRSTGIVNGVHKLELMELSDSQHPMRRLFDHAYEFNEARKNVFAGMRQVPTSSAVNSTVLVIAILQNEGVFRFASGAENVLRVKIYPEPGASPIGEVEISRGKNSVVKRLSTKDGLVYIPLPAGNEQIEIHLRSAEKGKQVLWEDPIIIGVAHDKL